MPRDMVNYKAYQNKYQAKWRKEHPNYFMTWYTKNIDILSNNDPRRGQMIKDKENEMLAAHRTTIFTGGEAGEAKEMPFMYSEGDVL